MTRSAKLLELIDTHCHIDIERHFPDIDAVINNAQAVGVCDLVLAGVHRSGWIRMLQLCQEHTSLHCAPGLHPMYMQEHKDEDLDELNRVAEKQDIVAIGEIGLDFYIENHDKKSQQKLFDDQLQIAKDASLPVLLHVRKAHDNVLAMLRRAQLQQGGIVHAFNGSYQQALQYISLGFKLGVGGTITYERARKIREVASKVPVEAIVLETDSPDMAPARYYKRRNEPSHLPLILKTLAGIRRADETDLAEITTSNARSVLRI